jgi:hypothetical protein
MRAAIEVGKWATIHASVAFGVMSTDTKIVAAGHVLSWLRGGFANCANSALKSIKKSTTLSPTPHTVTQRDIFTGVKGRSALSTVEKLKDALSILEYHGYIRGLASASPARPGRPPSQVFEVSPFLNTPLGKYSHNSQNPPCDEYERLEREAMEDNS